MYFELGFPKTFSRFIKDMNRSITELTDNDKIPEPERRIKYATIDRKFILNEQATQGLFADSEGI